MYEASGAIGLNLLSLRKWWGIHMQRSRKHDYNVQEAKIQALLFFIERSNRSRSGRYTEEERKSIDVIIGIIHSELAEISFDMFMREKAAEEKKSSMQRARDDRTEAKRYRQMIDKECSTLSKDRIIVSKSNAKTPVYGRCLAGAFVDVGTNGPFGP